MAYFATHPPAPGASPRPNGMYDAPKGSTSSSQEDTGRQGGRSTQANAPTDPWRVNIEFVSSNSCDVCQLTHHCHRAMYGSSPLYWSWPNLSDAQKQAVRVRVNGKLWVPGRIVNQRSRPRCEVSRVSSFVEVEASSRAWNIVAASRV